MQQFSDLMKDNVVVAAVAGAFISGIFVALGAVLTLWFTLWAQGRSDQRREQQELANIRLALHTEIGMIAGQCLLEFKDWLEAARNPAARKNPRTALLPNLTMFNAMAPRFGRLSRNEIVALIKFASTVSDISVVARSMSKVAALAEPNPAYEPEVLLHLFSNACGNAAECLRRIPVSDSHLDRKMIEQLDRAFKAREQERAWAKVQYDLT